MELEEADEIVSEGATSGCVLDVLIHARSTDRADGRRGPERAEGAQDEAPGQASELQGRDGEVQGRGGKYRPSHL